MLLRSSSSAALAATARLRLAAAHTCAGTCPSTSLLLCSRATLMPGCQLQQQLQQRLGGPSSHRLLHARGPAACSAAGRRRGGGETQQGMAAVAAAVAASAQQVHVAASIDGGTSHRRGRARSPFQPAAPLVQLPVTQQQAAQEAAERVTPSSLAAMQQRLQADTALLQQSMRQLHELQGDDQQREQPDSSNTRPAGLPDQVLLVGIDPDTHGAIAVVRSWLRWSRAPAASPQEARGSGSSMDAGRRRNGRSRSRSTTDGDSTTTSSSISSSAISSNSAEQVPQWQAHMCLPAADVRVYDMPVQTIPLRTKSKTGGQRFRRRLDIPGAIAITRQILLDTATQPLEHQQPQPPSAAAGGAAALSTSSSTTSTTTSSSSILLRAVLEVASITPSNGSLATLNQGYAAGAWTAVLAAHGFGVSTVNVKTWKSQLGLIGQDKDSSRGLAAALYQQAAAASQDGLLRNKKDHGRAEALLIAAWGLGWGCDAASRAPEQGPLRDVVQMDGGMHDVTQQQQQQQRQPEQGSSDSSSGADSTDADEAHAHAAGGTSDDEAALCGSVGIGGGSSSSNAVTPTSLVQLLRASVPVPSTTQGRVLDVASAQAAEAAAKAAAVQEKEQQRLRKAAARAAAAAERAAAREAARQAKAEAAAARRRATTAAASSSGTGSTRRRCSRRSRTTSDAQAAVVG